LAPASPAVLLLQAPIARTATAAHATVRATPLVVTGIA
jgi:hypothetical protein